MDYVDSFTSGLVKASEFVSAGLIVTAGVFVLVIFLYDKFFNR